MPIELIADEPKKPAQTQRETAPRQFTQNPFLAQRALVEKNLEGVGKVIAVHSGKGGVGKSTFSVNLALTLAQDGFKVGLIDADVDCPTCHKLLGAHQRVFADNEKRLQPLQAHGILVLSVGNMVENENFANIMRGPVMFKLISDLLSNANWGKLDYLIIDLPPGTGDNPLTIMQIAPLYGMIIVSQPMEVALADARKSADMAFRMNVPVIGFVENMSGDVFGKGGTEKTAREMKLNFLGTIPLDKKIRESSERGIPAVLEDKGFLEIFRKIIEEGAI